MRTGAVRRFGVAIGLSTAVAVAAAAQGTSREGSVSRALELERVGSYAEAAAAYRAVLARKPAEVGALLGLERVLLPLGRSATIMPEVRAALQASPRSAPLYGLALRTWAAADQPDSVRATAERWAAVAPGDEAPYREWGAAALARQDRLAARAAYAEGRARLGSPDALAAELAELATADGDYAAAAREWALAVRRFPGYRSTAAAALAGASESARPAVLAELGRAQSPGDVWVPGLAAELRARWGDPVGGFRALRRSLGDDQVRAVEALRAFLGAVRADRSREGRRAQGLALEEFASRVPSAQSPRLRLDAAQAYADAGDAAAAQRMLSAVAADHSTAGPASTDAASALVGVLADGGKPEDAARRLRELRPRLGSEQYDSLRRRVALGWVRAGDLSRADSAVAPDTTVEGLAVSGLVHLYEGDLRGAVRRLRGAGPYAGDRAAATHRTALLALLQPIEADSLPELGSALLRLERGDTAAALAALSRVADALPAGAGGAEVRLLAGRTAAAAGLSADAERLLRAATTKDAPGTAPAAALALAELLMDAGRGREAVPVLEQMILAYPQSALTPQARRRLDEARGAVPKT